ncbi:hypothetical protein CHLNCDRAFT_142988 [Chlorella variabilis]|uniref:SET domain-containing protein n=1 Tax=Chlorella variabilis TaxID=554065 RepID=E1Z984_CHLVA|nr:hypothetical protein CHLNCDRAFT_142988 [Chlorella variabilis]EFN57733.1 hypothetical protein CHLNCDRAFT_142988 [Chlorella variabilis]|eukprot:XP_005849835.1 hypothetical protein CHLNCDRAFT_142988 [Chlorella variabilis]
MVSAGAVPLVPCWWHDVHTNSYSKAAADVVRQRRAALGADTADQDRMRPDPASLQGFSEVERKGMPYCMDQYCLKDAAGKRAYFDALMQVQEITDASHPAKQSGLRVGRRHEWGVFATRPLPAGTLLGELCGMVCTGEEVDDAVAAEPRGVGGLRADQIKALWMTAGGEEGGRQPPRNGWARELVIDGSESSCRLRFMNAYDGLRAEANVVCVEAEDVGERTPHAFLVTAAEVSAGEELLLDYGAHFLRHIGEEERRAAAITALEGRVADLQQQLGKQAAHSRLHEQVYLDLLAEHKSVRQEHRQLQQQVHKQQRELKKQTRQLEQQEAQLEEQRRRPRADAAVQVGGSGAAQADEQGEEGAAAAAAAPAAAGPSNGEAARLQQQQVAAAAAAREQAPIAGFCSVAVHREAATAAQWQVEQQGLLAELAAKEREVEEQRAALDAGRQQWEAERQQLVSELAVIEQAVKAAAEQQEVLTGLLNSQLAAGQAAVAGEGGGPAVAPGVAPQEGQRQGPAAAAASAGQQAAAALACEEEEQEAAEVQDEVAAVGAGSPALAEATGGAAADGVLPPSTPMEAEAAAKQAGQATADAATTAADAAAAGSPTPVHQGGDGSGSEGATGQEATPGPDAMLELESAAEPEGTPPPATVATPAACLDAGAYAAAAVTAAQQLEREVRAVVGELCAAAEAACGEGQAEGHGPR